MLGLLSALPIVSAGNLCCCLWLVAGGLVAAYVLQQNQSTPITPGDGALAGVLAGVVGAFVYLVVSIPFAFLLSPLERRVMERLAAMGQLPPQLWAYGAGPISIGLRTIASFVLILVLGAILSTAGGVIGALIFAKNAPEAPTGPADGSPAS